MVTCDSKLCSLATSCDPKYDLNRSGSGETGREQNLNPLGSNWGEWDLGREMGFRAGEG